MKNLGDLKKMRIIAVILMCFVVSCNLRNPLKLKKASRDHNASQNNSETKDSKEGDVVGADENIVEFDLLMKSLCEAKIEGDQKENVAAQVKSNHAFAVKLFGKLTKSDSNVVFSPFSTALSLALTYAGASGDTAKEMKDVLSLSLEDSKLHETYLYLLQNLNCQENAAYEFKTVNALWAEQSYKFSKDFIKLANDKYIAPSVNVSFVTATEQVRKHINEWVFKATGEHIKEILPSDSITNVTRLVLTNAIYFKATWLKEFVPGETKDGDFWAKGSEKVTASFMRQKDSYNYAEIDAFKAIEIPYLARDKTVASRFSFIALLPNEKTGIAALEASLTSEKIEKIFGSLKPTGIILSLPKFKIDSPFELSKSLTDLGMKTAFSDEADFSGMTEEKKKDLYLANVQHQTSFDIHEKGSEASSATAIVANYKSSMPSYIDVAIDHPFLFLVKDKVTGMILFLGKVADPR